MKLTINRNQGSDGGHLLVEREPSDPKFYSESTFLHHIKKKLQSMGFDVIKKRMQKDGHMYGDEHTQYIRSRGRKPDKDSFAIYDGSYAVRRLYEPWNERGQVTLLMVFDIFEAPKRCQHGRRIPHVTAAGTCLVAADWREGA